jgi:hypothetical protein
VREGVLSALLEAIIVCELREERVAGENTTMVEDRMGVVGYERTVAIWKGSIRGLYRTIS